MIPRRYKNRRSTKLGRIEKKCDLILSEILIIHQLLTRRSDIDTVIDRLHKTARNMRTQCEHQRNNALKMFGSKKSEL